MDKLPSPEELKMKIIVKARKSSGEDAAKNEDDDEDGLDESVLGSTNYSAAGNIQSIEDVTKDSALQLNNARRPSTVTSSVESLLNEPNTSQTLEGVPVVTIKETVKESMDNKTQNVHQNDIATERQEQHVNFVEEDTRISMNVMMNIGADTQELKVPFT